MKINLITPSLVFVLSSFLMACEVESSLNQETEATTEISSENLSGFLNSEVFFPSTIHWERDELFGDEGFNIKLFQEEKECDEAQSISDISFFIVTENDLTVGAFEAKGPYFYYTDGDDYGTVSFLGANVIIDEVTETTITGRVKGGDNNAKHFIEGKFVAELCQQ